MINKTVGTGGDYATWTDAYNYLVGLGALSDDYTFTQISNITVSTWPDVSSGANQINFNSHTVKFTCTNWHQGDVNSGYITTCSGVGMQIKGNSSSNANCKFIFDKLNIRCTGFGVSTPCLQVGAWGSNLVHFSVFSNLIIIGNDRTKGTAIDPGLSRAYIRIYNCKISTMGLGLSMFPGSYTPGDPSTNRKFVENVSIHNFGSWGMYVDTQSDGYDVKYKNIVIAGTTGYTACIAWYGTSKHITQLDNCACTDTSLAGGVAHGETVNNYHDSIVLADEFQSTTSTNKHFLVPKNTGLLYNSGIAPTLMAVDITGRAIPDSSGNYPIGAHDYYPQYNTVKVGFWNIGSSAQSFTVSTTTSTSSVVDRWNDYPDRAGSITDVLVPTGRGLMVNGERVVTDRQPFVAGPTGGATIDAEARTAINSIRTTMITHGLMEAS